MSDVANRTEAWRMRNAPENHEDFGEEEDIVFGVVPVEHSSYYALAMEAEGWDEWDREWDLIEEPFDDYDYLYEAYYP